MLKRLRDRQWMSTAIARLQAMTPYRPERKRAVYVVQYGETYKIGLSFDPEQRIKAFMLPEVVATMRIYWVPKAEEFERALHKKYAAYREYGEWFRLPETTLNEMDAYAELWKQRPEA
jgi:hypothetical protein